MLLACGWQAPEVQQAGAGSPSVPHTEEAGPPSASRRGSCSPLAGPGISTSCSLQLRLPQDGHVASVDASTSAFSSPRAIYESLGQGSPKPSAPYKSAKGREKDKFSVSVCKKTCFSMIKKKIFLAKAKKKEQMMATSSENGGPAFLWYQILPKRIQEHNILSSAFMWPMPIPAAGAWRVNAIWLAQIRGKAWS